MVLAKFDSDIAAAKVVSRRARLPHAIQLLAIGKIRDSGTIGTRRRTHHGRRHRHGRAHWVTIVEGSHDSEVLEAARWGGKCDNCVR